MNDMKENRPELLAPAGDMERLQAALDFGADAVYLAGQMFGMRTAPSNFTHEQLQEAVALAHARGVRVYLTCNTVPRNQEIDLLPDYLAFVQNVGVDALIVTDLGAMDLAKRYAPKVELHVSTQAGIANYAAANAFYQLGAKRVVLARETTLEEIAEIRAKTPKDLEIEAFVHGAMCISYSGRCLLSNYLSGRDANKGACAHPCRWQYYVTEKTRPNEYMPIVEDDRGTYIFNSKDLCMIQHIPELIDAGIMSLKIEGRIKTCFYVGTVIRAYREAIDDYLKDPALYESKKDYYLQEVAKASYRGFTTGFYYGKPNEEDQIYTTSSYIRTYDFIGMVLDYNAETGFATIEQRNKFVVGDKVEFLRHNGEVFEMTVEEMYNDKGERITEAPHPQQIIKLKVDKAVENFDMMRKEAENPVTLQ